MNDRNPTEVISTFRRQRIVVLALKLAGILFVVSIPFANTIAKYAARSRSATTANTTLVSGIFAAGTGGSPLASTNFLMLGTIGEVALANNQTTLTSANFQLQPGFLAAMPAAIGPLYLPLLLRTNAPVFSGTSEIEPNNTLQQANGPLVSGVDYHGYENDASDYFSFYAAGGNISVHLTNTSAPGTQLYLYYQDNSHLVGHDGHIGSPPYHIDYTGAAGWYYARITAGVPFNSSMQYTLRVTYP
jgi:hypothetical protein